MLIVVAAAYILGIVWLYRFTQSAQAAVSATYPNLKRMAWLLSTMARACFPGFAFLWAIAPFLELQVPAFVALAFGFMAFAPLAVLYVYYARTQREGQLQGQAQLSGEGASVSGDATKEVASPAGQKARRGKKTRRR